MLSPGSEWASDLCSWEIFTQRRHFNLQAENRQFLDETLRTGLYQQTYPNTLDHGRPEGETEENKKSMVEDFMREDNYRGVVDRIPGAVDRLCQGTSITDLQNLDESHRKVVAWLDERQNSGDEQLKLTSRTLDAQQLYHELRRPRYHKDSNGMPEAKDEPDTERRLIYLSNLDRFTTLALVATTPHGQIPAVQNLLLKHLNCEPSIGVTISTYGFRTFTLDFHLPYYAIRSDKNVRDTRILAGGRSLRECFQIHCSDGGKPLRSPLSALYNVYEAHVSFSIVGIDNWRWTAYCIEDTYFESDNIFDEYLEPQDPISAGCYDSNCTIWDPRQYFLKILEVRTHQIQSEWTQLVQCLDDLSQRINNRVPSNVNHQDGSAAVNPHAPEPFQDVAHLLRLATRIEKYLSGSLHAWKIFKEAEIGYFYENTDNTTSRFEASSKSVYTIRKAFGEMELLAYRLQHIKAALHEAKLGSALETRLESGIGYDSPEERATANNEKTVTFIALLMPLCLMANLYSMHPGILSFNPNFRSLVILVSFTILCAIVSFMWLTRMIRHAYDPSCFSRVSRTLQQRHQTSMERKN